MIFCETHVFHTQVEFDDLDAGGVVHHPKYLHFLERARTRAMNDAGCSYADSMKAGVAFVVAEVRAKYLRPLRYEEKITVLTRCVAIRRSSLKVFQAIVPGPISAADAQALGANFLESKNLVFIAQLRLVAIDLTTLAPRELPDDLKRAFKIPDDKFFAENKHCLNTQIKDVWTHDAKG